MNFLLSGFTIVLQLVFIVCLLFLSIKTKSIGVFLIFLTLLIGRIFQWVSFRFFIHFLQDIEKIGGLRSYEVFNIISHITLWIILIVCSLGVMLIYHEWKNGKFQITSSINQQGHDVHQNQ